MFVGLVDLGRWHKTRVKEAESITFNRTTRKHQYTPHKIEFPLS